MKFVRTHLISLICGAAALAFVVVGILGMTSDRVEKDMQARLASLGASQIGQLQSQAKNQKVIDAEKAKGDSFQREYEETLKAAYAINRREVLMPGVFPKPERMATPFEFVDAYKAAIKSLPRRMDGGTLPTAADVEQEATEVEELRRLDREREVEGGAAAPAIAAGTAGAAPTPGAAPLGSGRDLDRGVGAGGAGSSLDPTADDPRYNPQVRARVSKAKSIRVYYDEAESLHISPIVNATDSPTQRSMWQAQVGYWIQQDIIEAIRELNAEFGKAADGELSVEDVPVKRLVRMRVFGYQTPAALIPFEVGAGGPGSSSSGGELSPGASFTGRKSNEQFDVLRFAVEVVIDQRDINRLIDRICRRNFYQLLNITVRNDPLEAAADAQAGYLYGVSPVVRVQLDFEGYLARAVYKPLMPEAVVTELTGAGQAEQP